jgi:Ca2+-transporting ATPase
MTTVHEVPGEGHLVLVKGAPEAVIDRCAPGPARGALEDDDEAMVADGLRVLAFAQGGDSIDATNLTPLGAIGFADPLRDSTVPAVAQLDRAGIRLVMVTGDHLDTARAAARKAGLKADPAVTGAELAAAPEGQRAHLLESAQVLARVEPGVKLDLVRAHQAAGHVVGMTGDGVNDAPALRVADVGVAMAVGAGTDVAREAASIVVTDANLGTITAAVREGRLIFRNLLNAIAYLLTGNVSEVVVVLGGLLLIPDLAVPLLPVQLLWINLITDGLPAIALGVDTERGDLMAEAPRPAHIRLLTWRRQTELAVRGGILGAIVLGSGLIARQQGWSEEQIRGQLLMSVVAAHLVLAYIVRSAALTFERGWLNNRTLLAAVGGSLALQIVVLNIPWTRDALGVPEMPAASWLLAAGVALAIILVADTLRIAARLLHSTP